jgi:hypothetical protein
VGKTMISGYSALLLAYFHPNKDFFYTPKNDPEEYVSFTSLIFIVFVLITL